MNEQQQFWELVEKEIANAAPPKLITRNKSELLKLFGDSAFLMEEAKKLGYHTFPRDNNTWTICHARSPVSDFWNEIEGYMHARNENRVRSPKDLALEAHGGLANLLEQAGERKMKVFFNERDYLVIARANTQEAKAIEEEMEAKKRRKEEEAKIEAIKKAASNPWLKIGTTLIRRDAVTALRHTTERQYEVWIWGQPSPFMFTAEGDINLLLEQWPEAKEL
jgi:hypothetical protein